MLAKQHAPKALASKESRRGALDAQFLKSLAPLALEFILGEIGILRQVRDQFEQFSRKFRQPGNRNGARVRASMRSKVGAHAPQIFFDLPAVARCRAGAHHRRRHSRETRVASSR